MKCSAFTQNFACLYDPHISGSIVTVMYHSVRHELSIKHAFRTGPIISIILISGPREQPRCQKHSRQSVFSVKD